MDTNHETPLSEVSYNLTPAPRQMCIYLVVVISYNYNIGSSGKFPLLVYCALTIASLDLIECIGTYIVLKAS